MSQAHPSVSAPQHETDSVAKEFITDNGRLAHDDSNALQQENALLRAKVQEMEQLFVAVGQETEEEWAERQRDYESLLEEKSEVIRSLHQRIAELREHAAASPSASAAAPDCAELSTLKAELEEQRQQMREDEESMMAQMRQMEMALAKDRAELARQRAEVQRLQSEVKHEVEVAARDGGLRDRLGALHRRATNVTNTRASVTQDTPAPKPVPASTANLSKSGLFRRIFGAGQ